MATWIMHLRVAEKILEELPFDRESFMIGNLAPDCNKANEDWSSFKPSKSITHYYDENGKIDLPGFLRNYFDENSDSKYKAFVLGYYSHLYTDILWGNEFREHKRDKPEMAQKLEEDSSFIWVVKRDWYGQDFKYLRENKENIFVDEFISSAEVPQYFDFFPASTMNEKLNYIKEYYQSDDPDITIDDFKYLDTQTMDNFIDSCSDEILKILKSLL